MQTVLTCGIILLLQKNKLSHAFVSNGISISQTRYGYESTSSSRSDVRGLPSSSSFSSSSGFGFGSVSDPYLKSLSVVSQDRVNDGEMSLEDDELNTMVDEAVDQVQGLRTLLDMDDDLDVIEDEEESDAVRDAEYMKQAITIARHVGGERGKASPFPNPISGALLVSKDDKIIGSGYSNYKEDCVEAVIRDAGISATPLREWCVGWPSDKQLRDDLAECTLYLTLEPSAERKGAARPPLTKLIEYAGITRVVIGAPNPIKSLASEGAATLHSAGIQVSMGVEQERCEEIISSYIKLANTQIQKMARYHLNEKKRPMGFLHCSVIDSHDAKAFARNGNAFGKEFGGGQVLSKRDFGSYEIAPPPESIWAENKDNEEDIDWETEAEPHAFFSEDDDEELDLTPNPIMPWYEQVDAVISTFPKSGNGPLDDDSIMTRLKGLKWLATQGKSLPSSVERILVMDATDLPSLPLTNTDDNLPPGVNVEEFWRGEDRKPTRILLRHSTNALAAAAADAAAAAAEAARLAAMKAREAIDSGDAEMAAESAIEAQNAALAHAAFIQKEVQVVQDIKEQLAGLGVLVETIRGGKPINVMNHLGERSGYQAVVWRAGCWGERGVQSILDGAFQWVSAHLAVDAMGGKFWQLMLAERCVQGACGPESKVKVYAEDEDIRLEYCDDESADADCTLTLDGRPIRHVRLDCRVGLIDDVKYHENPVKPSTNQFNVEDAP